jgi:hypothetical protein
MEETAPAFMLAQQIFLIHNSQGGFSRIRFFAITDGISKLEQAPPAPVIGNVEVTVHIWDIERLYRWYTSGKDREELVIDFSDEPGGGIPCLILDEKDTDYVAYLAAVPAPDLVRFYGQYGPRLLERNVRSFLQIKGGINKGIRQTILEEPGRFFAYNNGITATASEITIRKRADGMAVLAGAKDLQIVNGGQTTASLFRAARKDGADIDGILVSMKLSVVRDSEDIDEFVAHISKYANSQNKVNAADLSANDPYHRRVEELSRTEWAPAKSGKQYETHWFYERARAQYVDEWFRMETPGQKKAFEKKFPREQKFEKTDLAKYEQAWDQLPHIVSKGAQKNFVNFTERLESRGRVVPDLRYFHAMIGRKILWDATDKIVREEKYSYKINVVAYTVALLSHITARRLDFEKIWVAQSLPPVISDFIRAFAVDVSKVIESPPGGNITDWHKSEKCWKEVKELDVRIPAPIERFLVSAGSVVGPTLETPTGEESEEIESAASVSAEIWMGIAAWAKKTNSLTSWQRSLSYSLGKLAVRGSRPSYKQAKQGLKILEEARRLGFTDDWAASK